MAQHFIDQGEPVAKMLRIVGVHSSTYYARSVAQGKGSDTKPVSRRGRPPPGYSLTRSGRKVSDEQVKEYLMELVAGEEHVYGYRLLTKCLRDRYDLVINHKKVYRLCLELDILQPQRRTIVRYPRKLARIHTIKGPNELWQIDIKYGYVAGYDQFFFMANVIDVFDRYIVGYYAGSTCEAKHVCNTVRKALALRVGTGGPKPILRTDNGPQFVSRLFQELCERESITHERIPPRTPNMNAYVESFHATLERDLLSKTTFDTFDDAFSAVDRYIDFYNNRRMHGSLKQRSPVNFLKDIERGLLDPSQFARAV